MDPQTKIKAQPAIIAITLAAIAFGVLVFGSYEIGMWRAIGVLIAIYGLVTLIGGIYAIARKRNYVVMKNSTIVITGILTIVIGAIFIL